MAEWSTWKAFYSRTPGVSGSSPVEDTFFFLIFNWSFLEDNVYIHQYKAFNENVNTCIFGDNFPPDRINIASQISIVSFDQNERHFTFNVKSFCHDN